MGENPFKTQGFSSCLKLIYASHLQSKQIEKELVLTIKTKLL